MLLGWELEKKDHCLYQTAGYLTKKFFFSTATLQQMEASGEEREGCGASRGPWEVYGRHLKVKKDL